MKLLIELDLEDSDCLHSLHHRFDELNKILHEVFPTSHAPVEKFCKFLFEHNPGKEKVVVFEALSAMKDQTPEDAKIAIRAVITKETFDPTQQMPAEDVELNEFSFESAEREH